MPDPPPAVNESRIAREMLDGADERGELDADDTVVTMLCVRGDKYAQGLWAEDVVE